MKSSIGYNMRSPKETMVPLGRVTYVPHNNEHRVAPPGVAMPTGPCSKLPNRPLSTCFGFSRQSLSGLIGRGLLSVLFARTTIMQSRACSVLAPTVWNGLPPALYLLPRTISDPFYNQLKTFLFDRAGVGSSFLEEVLYKSLNERMNSREHSSALTVVC